MSTSSCEVVVPILQRIPIMQKILQYETHHLIRSVVTLSHTTSSWREVSQFFAHRIIRTYIRNPVLKRVFHRCCLLGSTTAFEKDWLLREILLSLSPNTSTSPSSAVVAENDSSSLQHLTSDLKRFSISGAEKETSVISPSSSSSSSVLVKHKPSPELLELFEAPLSEAFRQHDDDSPIKAMEIVSATGQLSLVKLFIEFGCDFSSHVNDNDYNISLPFLCAIADKNSVEVFDYFISLIKGKHLTLDDETLMCICNGGIHPAAANSLQFSLENLWLKRGEFLSLKQEKTPSEEESEESPEITKLMRLDRLIEMIGVSAVPQQQQQLQGQNRNTTFRLRCPKELTSIQAKTLKKAIPFLLEEERAKLHHNNSSGNSKDSNNNNNDSMMHKLRAVLELPEGKILVNKSQPSAKDLPTNDLQIITNHETPLHVAIRASREDLTHELLLFFDNNNNAQEQHVSIAAEIQSVKSSNEFDLLNNENLLDGYHRTLAHKAASALNFEVLEKIVLLWEQQEKNANRGELIFPYFSSSSSSEKPTLDTKSAVTLTPTEFSNIRYLGINKIDSYGITVLGAALQAISELNPRFYFSTEAAAVSLEKGKKIVRFLVQHRALLSTSHFDTLNAMTQLLPILSKQKDLDRIIVAKRIGFDILKKRDEQKKNDVWTSGKMSEQQQQDEKNAATNNNNNDNNTSNSINLFSQEHDEEIVYLLLTSLTRAQFLSADQIILQQYVEENCTKSLRRFVDLLLQVKNEEYSKSATSSDSSSSDSSSSSTWKVLVKEHHRSKTMNDHCQCLFKAISNKNQEIVGILLDFHNEVFDLKSSSAENREKYDLLNFVPSQYVQGGDTPLSFAVNKTEDVKIVEYLLSRGADRNKKDASGKIPDIDGLYMKVKEREIAEEKKEEQKKKMAMWTTTTPATSSSWGINSSTSTSTTTSSWGNSNNNNNNNASAAAASASSTSTWGNNTNSGFSTSATTSSTSTLGKKTTKKKRLL